LHQLTGLQHLVVLTVVGQRTHEIEGFVLFWRTTLRGKFVLFIARPATFKVFTNKTIRVREVLHEDLSTIVQLRDSPGGQQPGYTRFEVIKIFTDHRIESAQVVIIKKHHISCGILIHEVACDGGVKLIYALIPTKLSVQGFVDAPECLEICNSGEFGIETSVDCISLGKERLIRDAVHPGLSEESKARIFCLYEF